MLFSCFIGLASEKILWFLFTNGYLPLDKNCAFIFNRVKEQIAHVVIKRDLNLRLLGTGDAQDEAVGIRTAQLPVQGTLKQKPQFLHCHGLRQLFRNFFKVFEERAIDGDREQSRFEAEKEVKNLEYSGDMNVTELEPNRTTSMPKSVLHLLCG